MSLKQTVCGSGSRKVSKKELWREIVRTMPEQDKFEHTCKVLKENGIDNTISESSYDTFAVQLKDRIARILYVNLFLTPDKVIKYIKRHS